MTLWIGLAALVMAIELVFCWLLWVNGARREP